MPPCRTTFDENRVHPWTRGDFRGVSGYIPQLPRAHLVQGGNHTLSDEAVLPEGSALVKN